MGIGWGLPNDLHRQSYHPDEGVIWEVSQRIEPTRLDFTPGFYNYGTLYLTTLRVLSDAVAIYGQGLDPENPESYWRYRGECHLAGRILSALAGAGTVLVVFCLLRRFSGIPAGVFGALLVLVAPGHVVHSRFQTVDVFAAFLLMVSLYYAVSLKYPVRAEGRELLKRVLLAGAFAGLSAGVKYTGGLAVLGALAAIATLPLPLRIRARYGGLAVAASAVFFFLATPGALLDTGHFLHDLQYERQHMATGHGILYEQTSHGLIYQFLNLNIGVGLFATLLGGAGLAFAAARKHSWALIVLAFALPYYLLIGDAEVKFLRYALPLIPCLAVGFGWLMEAAHRKRGWARGLVAAGLLGLGGFDFGGLQSAATMTGWMMREDPRDVCARYLKALAQDRPELSVGLVSDPWFWTPPLFPDASAGLFVNFGGLSDEQIAERRALIAEATAPRVIRYFPNDPRAKKDWDVRLLSEDRPDFVVYSSFESKTPERLLGRRGLSPVAQATTEDYAAFMEQLKRDYAPDHTFGAQPPPAHDLEYIQPRLWVWKRNATP